MSNLNDVGLIAGITISGYFVVLTAERWIHERGDALATGLMRGVPMSTKHRWLLLFNNWLPNAVGVAVFSLCVALTLIAIAREASDRFVGVVAYLSAVGFGFACVFWVVLGSSWLVWYVSLLREAEAEAD